MSRKTDVALAKSIIDMFTRRREQLLEEYAELAHGDQDDPTNRDLRMKKSGAIDEVANLRSILHEVIDSAY